MRSLFLFGGLSVLFMAAQGCNLKSSSGCKADSDCKGDRICQAGNCVAPPIAAQPIAAQPIAAQQPVQAREQTCGADRDCQGGHVCENRICVKAETRTALPQPAMQVTPQPPSIRVVDGFGVGKRGCVMHDSTGDYNRLCTVSEDPPGTLKIHAPGTSLNPTIGFDMTFTGEPDSYNVSGTMTAFDACTGPFTGVTERVKLGNKDWYKVPFKGKCVVMISLQSF